MTAEVLLGLEDKRCGFSPQDQTVGLLTLAEQKTILSIPLFHFNDMPFSGYHLSDIRSEYVSALKNRVNKILNNVNMDVFFDTCNFPSKAEQLFTGIQPQHWKETGYLVFLDPFGLDVDWESMERVLKSGPVDVIFTFMTWAIVWNKNNKLAEDKLTTYFGDNRWKKLRTQDDFVNHYCEKIRKLGYRENYKTSTIAVIQEGGKRYDVILATQSPGGANVLRDLKVVVDTVNTELIDSAFAVTVGAKQDLDSFM